MTRLSGLSHLLLLLLTVLSCQRQSCSAETVEEAISELQRFTLEQTPCVRLMTDHGFDVGCSTGQHGVTGAIVYVTTVTELMAVEAFGSDPKRTVVMPIDLVTANNLDLLGSYGNVAGVVIALYTTPSSFSPAEKTQADSPDPVHEWNPQGLGLLRKRYAFPMVVVNRPETERLVALARENADIGHNSYPKKALHFYFDMGPADLTSSQCLDEQSCLPLGGQSVWATIGDPRTVGKPVVMAAARADARALFHELAFGSESTVSGYVALLAAADALSRAANINTLPKRVAFGLFQGEAWGRIGSRRFVEEVSSFTCTTSVAASDSPTGFEYCRDPLRSDLSFTSLGAQGVDAVVSVDQVGLPGTTAGFVHTESGSLAQDIAIRVSTDDASLPSLSKSTLPSGTTPSSPSTSFSALASTTERITLSDYDTSFTNRYYESEFDEVSNVDPEVVTKMSTILARTLYALATDQPTVDLAVALIPADLSVNATLVDTIITCISANSSCSYLAEIVGGSGQPSAAYSLYTGIYNQPFTSGEFGFGLQPTILELFARSFLAHVTATPHGETGEDTACSSNSECKDLNTKLECVVGRCIVSTAHYHDALSPAVSPTSTYGRYTVDSSKVSDMDPVWTEPYWAEDIGVTGYTLGDPIVPPVVFVAGLLTVAVSAIGVFFLNKLLAKVYKIE